MPIPTFKTSHATLALAVFGSALMPREAAAQRVSPASLEARTVPRADTSVTLHVGDGATARDLVSELRVPSGAGPHPVVIVIHGGCWVTKFADARYMRPLAESLRQQGFATWTISYRRADEAGGGWPGTFLDVAAQAAQLRALAPRYALDLTRVIASGHSAGAHLALWLAAQPKLPSSSAALRSAQGVRVVETGDQKPVQGVGVVEKRAVQGVRVVETGDQKPVQGVGVVEKGGERLAVQAVVALDGPGDLVAANTGISEICGGPVLEQLMGSAPASATERWREASPSSFLPLGVPQAMVRGGLDARMAKVDGGVGSMPAYAKRARESGDSTWVVMADSTSHFTMLDPEHPAYSVVLQAMRDALAAIRPATARRNK